MRTAHQTDRLNLISAHIIAQAPQELPCTATRLKLRAKCRDRDTRERLI